MIISVHSATDPDELDESLNREIEYMANDYDARFCNAQFRTVFNHRVNDMEYSAFVTYSEPADRIKNPSDLNEPTG